MWGHPCWLAAGTTPRGFTCTPGNPDPLNCVHFLSTPKITQAARDFFDCASLAGVELENQDTSCGVLGA